MNFKLLILLAVVLVVHARRQTVQDRLTADFLERNNLQGVRDSVPERWFTQKLDHFSNNNATWQQRYFVNNQHWTPGGPLFVFIEGEGQASAFWATNSSVTFNAQQFHGAVILLEHRFYGKSQPMPDWSVSSLKYLSSQQALADLVEFINWYKANTPGARDSKVVSFGGSYAGALSAWARYKYPDVIHASISSSGPVKAILDFTEYHEVVQKSLGAECSAFLKKANEKIVKMDKSQLGKYFPGCKNFNDMSDLDLLTFYDAISEQFDGVVQYNNYNNKKMNIDVLCGILMSNASDPLDGYVRLQRTFMELDGSSCIDNDYAASVADLRDIHVTPEANMRQWSWQTCTEFGYYQSTDASNPRQPFLSMMPLSFYLKQMCDDAFEPNLRPHIDYTNQFYGSTDINFSRIYFVNSGLDPWHALSVLKQSNPLQPVLMIDRHSHCSDLHQVSADDDYPMKMAHINIAKRLAEFLAM